jgi:HEAT repeat protein
MACFEVAQGQDNAAPLRSICAMALVHCAVGDLDILEHLVDLFGDPEPTVRINAIKAIANFSSREAALLIRAKANAGDAEADVTGQCFASLLDISPTDYLAYVGRFVRNENEDLRYQAILALSSAPSSESVEALKTLLNDTTDFQTHEQVLMALGRSRHKEATAFLLHLIEKGEVGRAAKSIKALANGPFRDVLLDQVKKIVIERKDSSLKRTFRLEFEHGG